MNEYSVPVFIYMEESINTHTVGMDSSSDYCCGLAHAYISSCSATHNPWLTLNEMCGGEAARRKAEGAVRVPQSGRLTLVVLLVMS